MIDKIRGYFERYGEVESIDLRAKDDIQWGYVQFKSAINAANVLSDSDHRIDDCVIKVEAAHQWKQPNNILNALDDQCFYNIFKFLDLSDLANVADVCVRFNQQAKKAFSTSELKRMVLPCSRYVVNNQPNEMRKIVRHFGANLQSLSIDTKSRGGNHYLLRAMLEYCSDELKELRLESFLIEKDAPNLGPLFSGLEKLEMANCVVEIELDQSMASCDGLKSLRFDNCHLKYDKCIGRTFGHLKRAFILDTNFSADIVRQFIVSNPTITELSIKGIEHRVLCAIGENLAYLQNLEFVNRAYYLSGILRGGDDMLTIAQLKFLKRLKLNLNYAYDWTRLLNALHANNVLIEHLGLGGVLICDSVVESICKMNQLEILDIDDFLSLTKDDLIKMAKRLPELLELRLLESYCEVDFIDVKEILQYAGKLKFLSLRSRERGYIININDYNQILHILKSRSGQLCLRIDGGIKANFQIGILWRNRESINIEIYHYLN